ncbi:MAG: hypothetical protein WCK92_00340 [Bacteroidota bacterium]
MKKALIALISLAFYIQLPAQTAYIARLPQEFHKVMGCGPTTAIYAGDKADHRATFIYAVLHQKNWFDEFLKK